MTTGINGTAYMITLAEAQGLHLEVDEQGELLISPAMKADSVTVHHLLGLKLWIVPFLTIRKILAESHRGLLLHQLKAISGLDPECLRLAVAMLVEEGELRISEAGVFSIRETVN